MTPATLEERKPEPLKGIPIPPDIEDRIKRGRVAMRKDAYKRRLYMKFWQGEQYWYLKAKGNGLGVLSTAIDATDKQNFRIRNTYNFIHSIVEGKVSAATQRTPGYEIDPATTDPEDVAGARLAQQVAEYGYDKWRLRRHTTKAVTNALVQREGFVMPYFDQNVGPFEMGPDGKWQGQGEIKFLNLCRSEVGWEPGQDFDDSRWHIIERAHLKEDIQNLPGFVGGVVTANAKLSDLPEDKVTDQMVVLTEYLERPCPDYPEGRRCFVANGRIITNYRKIEPDADSWWEPYPSFDAEGNVTDEMPIHRISYTVDPHGDDRGLVEHLIDLQKTIMDCWNKVLEWKNRVLLPQMIAPKGSRLPPRDDRPGATYEYNLTGGKPEWEPKPNTPISELLDICEHAISHMRALAADLDVPQDLSDVAAKTLNSAIQQAQLRWQSFLGDLAEFHSRLMRHCLTLVAQHYERDRLIPIRGQYGWEPPVSFTGQDLRSQVNVRVFPGSLETKNRQMAMEEIRFVKELWPDSLSPEVAMAAIHGSNPEGLFKSYELHQARAWELVQKLRTNPEALLSEPMRFDMEFGDPAMGFMVPEWMPRKQDNIVIWKQVIADYMITPDFQEQPPETKEMFDLIWRGLEDLEQRKMMKLAMQEQDAAVQLGAANAAKPQGPIPSPQMPQGLSREQGEPAAMTPG